MKKLTINKGRMPKRKAEGLPITEPMTTVLDPKPNTTENSANLAREATTDLPVDGGQSGGATGIHLDPLSSEVDEDALYEGNPFWTLLALAGYETW